MQPPARLKLAEGTHVRYDRLVLAVGGEAVRPPRLVRDRVVALRTIEDANRLSAMLADAERVVIVGGGFIGTEVASMAVARGLGVTVVEVDRLFARLLGDRVAERICAMHRHHGVTLITGIPLDSVKRDGSAFRVDTCDGRRLAADVVVVAVGMRPATAWLADSALRAPCGIRCDADGRTMVPDVFAAGDCALALDTAGDGYATAEHWDVASRHGVRVARAILGLPAPAPRAPYFWSDQHGLKLQLVGRTHPADTVEIEESTPWPCFLARYLRKGRLLSLFVVGAGAAIGQARLRAGALDSRCSAGPHACTSVALRYVGRFSPRKHLPLVLIPQDRRGLEAWSGGHQAASAPTRADSHGPVYRSALSAHVNIDRQLCIGSGTCVRLAAGAFALDDAEIATVVDPDAVEVAKLRLAAEACPTGAISLVETEGDGAG